MRLSAPLKKSSNDLAVWLRDRVGRYLTLKKPTDPIEWIENNISFRWDTTSVSDSMVKLEPYQIRPIRAQYQKTVREVTIMAVEQTGKSTCWRFPMVHKTVELPAPRWIIYESKDKAAEINKEQLDPILRKVEDLQGMFTKETASRARYDLPNGSVIDFTGAGAPITSKPKRDGVADEVDTWPLTEAGIRDNLENFKKRFRTYWRKGQGCLVKVSSPAPRKKGATQDMTHSVIGDEFDESDQGYWTLRCLKCRKLSIPSHATYLLQWEMTEDNEVKPKSITLDCPKCGHTHKEQNAQKMNDMGAYCDKSGKDLTGTWPEHVGCQWGAIAAPRVFSWLQIAKEQLKSGSTADLYAQARFDNSWRGIPFRPRRKDSPGMDALRKHCTELPDPKQLANIFLSADTQDSGWYWIVRGVDAEGNLYRLGAGFVRTIQELEQVWDTKFLGMLCAMGIIDEGGHGDMPKHVRELVDKTQGLYAYKGTGSTGTKWKHGNQKKTILAAAKQYKADLLYYMYSQKDRSNNYWFLPPFESLSEDYCSQMVAIQPNQKVKHGDRFENWDVSSQGVADHYFDCEKQLLVLLDVAYAELSPDNWKFAVPGIRRGRKPKPKRRQPGALNL
jgi:hypothetical protein